MLSGTRALDCTPNVFWMRIHPYISDPYSCLPQGITSRRYGTRRQVGSRMSRETSADFGDVDLESGILSDTASPFQYADRIACSPSRSTTHGYKVKVDLRHSSSERSAHFGTSLTRSADIWGSEGSFSCLIKIILVSSEVHPNRNTIYSNS